MKRLLVLFVLCTALLSVFISSAFCASVYALSGDISVNLNVPLLSGFINAIASQSTLIASPTTTTPGSSVTLTVVLQESGIKLANHTVHLFISSPASTSGIVQADGTTDSSGTYVTTFSNKKSATYIIGVEDTTYVASFGQTITITQTAKIVVSSKKVNTQASVSTSTPTTVNTSTPTPSVTTSPTITSTPIPLASGVTRGPGPTNPLVQVVQIAGLLVPTVIVLGYAAAGTSGFLNIFVALLQDIGLGFSRLLERLSIKRKVPPWGIVYDAVTKMPLSAVVVTLMSNDGSVPEQKTKTNIEGKYGFLVPQGTYRLEINRFGYHFPSNELKGLREDGDRMNLYFGGEISLQENSVVNKVNMDIPLDPLNREWNHTGIEDASWGDRLKKFALALFVFGFGASIISCFIWPSLLNILLTSLYPILFILGRISVKESWGRITREGNHDPVYGIGIRALRGDHQVPAGYTMSDELGRYYLALPKGEYQLQVEGTTSDGIRRILKTLGPITIRGRETYVNKDITL